jgi:SAM-dependent methyltransferase
MTPISRCDWEQCGKGLVGSGSGGQSARPQPASGGHLFLDRRSPSLPHLLVRGVLNCPHPRPGRRPRIVCCVPDQIFADPRLAAIYDDIDGDRADLDHYEAIVEELGARSVLDIGCGTGVLACRLARRGITMIGLDPALASLAVARTKPGADRITWLVGDATMHPSVVVDAVTMTGNVAQVFLDDEEWSAVLVGVRRVLCDGGHLVFETRDPSFRGWEEWTRERSISVRDTIAGPVECWVELTKVELPLVSFRHSFRFLDGGDIVTSDSTLRFRDRDEIAALLAAVGFAVEDVRDAPDRPGREFVFIARSIS